MVKQRVIVQASSRSWSGDRDLCMAQVDGQPVVYRTIRRILEYIPNAEVKIAAPAFDLGGDLEPIVHAFAGDSVSIFYGHDSSPLNRMLDICRDLRDDDFVIRIDGLHFCVDLSVSVEMRNLSVASCLDCVKLPDDFPVQFTSEVYRIGSLRTVDRMLSSDKEAIFRVHPKFFMFARKDAFRCAYFEDLPTYSDDYLQQCREIARTVYAVPRIEVNDQRIWAGDQLSFHYELALEQCHPGMKLLDVACGDGYGTRMLAAKVAEAHGADLDPEIVSHAREFTNFPNVEFHVEDVTHMTFSENQFDVVSSMETIEHVDHELYLSEIKRVLKPGGILILSTPQNRVGHIPVNAGHLREYSLEEISVLCNQYFRVKKIIGIKSGRVVIPDDPYGTNTMLVCTKQ